MVSKEKREKREALRKQWKEEAMRRDDFDFDSSSEDRELAMVGNGCRHGRKSLGSIKAKKF